MLAETKREAATEDRSSAVIDQGYMKDGCHTDYADSREIVLVENLDFAEKPTDVLVGN